MKKIRVGVVRGGRSGEHEVSLRSAESILKAIDRNKYEVVSITIAADGKGGNWIPADSFLAAPPGTRLHPCDAV
jgi:D-alanine-D-alanine ligase